MPAGIRQNFFFSHVFPFLSWELKQNTGISEFCFPLALNVCRGGTEGNLESPAGGTKLNFSLWVVHKVLLRTLANLLIPRWMLVNSLHLSFAGLPSQNGGDINQVAPTLPFINGNLIPLCSNDPFASL